MNRIESIEGKAGEAEDRLFLFFALLSLRPGEIIRVDAEGLIWKAFSVLS
jgi:hypothetical protein